MKLKDRVIRSIGQRKGRVILRSDFAELGSPSQLSRVLAAMVNEGKLIRVGLGIYAKARINQFTQQPSVDGTLEEVASEAFRRLGIPVSPSQAMEEYNAGRTTQMPMEYRVKIGKRRISRRIKVGSQTVKYEKARQR